MGLELAPAVHSAKSCPPERPYIGVSTGVLRSSYYSARAARQTSGMSGTTRPLRGALTHYGQMTQNVRAEKGRYAVRQAIFGGAS